MAYVLVIDDDVDSQQAVAGYLTKRSHRVACARNGREAIRTLVDFPIPDAVVLDARMPEMDGVTFLEVIRSYLRWQTMPVFMLTAYAEGEHIDRAVQLGVNRIFLKANFEMAELASQIESAGFQTSGGSPGSSIGPPPPDGLPTPSMLH